MYLSKKTWNDTNENKIKRKGEREDRRKGVGSVRSGQFGNYFLKVYGKECHKSYGAYGAH